MDPRTPTDVDVTGTLPVAGEALAPSAGLQDRQGHAPAWVTEARGALETPGRYLAFEGDDGGTVVQVKSESTRIGRSLAADIRFDDATVSRRHALVVSQPDGVRLLDDRSLNGVYVNGERVESVPLADGDRIAVGRHTLWFLDTTGVQSAASTPPLATLD